MKGVRAVAVFSVVLAGMMLGHGVAYAASAAIAGLYPAAEVPIGATVTFSVVTSGFTNPTFYLVDSFPGGVTTTNINSSGDFSWKPNIDDVGTHSLTIAVSDLQGDSASVSQTITVDGSASVSIQSLTPGTNVNIGVPVSFLISSSGLLNPAYTITDSFFYSSIQNYDINTAGGVNWTPIMQDIGSHTLTVTAKDAYGNVASASTDITVLPIPTLTIANLVPGTSIDVNQPFSFTATSTGFVNPVYMVSDSFVGISTSTITINTSGQANWIPQYNDVGVHPMQVVASDATGRFATTTLSVTVLPQIFAAASPAATPAVSVPLAQMQNTNTAAPFTSQPPLSIAPSAPARTQTTKSAAASQAGAESTFTQTQTAPLFTDAFVSNTPGSSTASTSAGLAVPIQPAMTFGAFLLNYSINFFASLLKLF